MRLLKYTLLGLALVAMSAASANAYSISMTTDYTGATLGASDYVTVQIWMDTEGESNIVAFQVSVDFDETLLSYERSLSLTGGNPGYPGYPNYILYGTAPNGRGTLTSYMEPRVPTTGGFTWDPAKEIIPGTAQIGWYATALSGGLSFTSATATNVLLGTLVFHVLPGTGPAFVDVSFDTAGSGFILGGGTNVTDQVGLSGNFVVTVPEPTTALLIGLGIIGLGVAGRRR